MLLRPIAAVRVKKIRRGASSTVCHVGGICVCFEGPSQDDFPGSYRNKGGYSSLKGRKGGSDYLYVKISTGLGLVEDKQG